MVHAWPRPLRNVDNLKKAGQPPERVLDRLLEILLDPIDVALAGSGSLLFSGYLFADAT